MMGTMRENMNPNYELIPNRVFVGGLPISVNEQELKEYFCKLTGSDNVKEVKLPCDMKGNPKGFGFLTFETEIEASKVLNMKSDGLLFKDTKLNIANAYKRKTYMSNNYRNGSNNSSNMNSCNIQTENFKPENYCMSPTSGRVLNIITPTPPPDTEISVPITNLDANKPEIKNNNVTKIVGLSSEIDSDSVKTNSSESNEEKSPILVNKNDFDDVKVQKEDKNNNIIDAKLHNLNTVEADAIKINNKKMKIEDSSIKKPLNNSITKKDYSVNSSYTQNKPRNYQGNNYNNQRNYSVNNNRSNNSYYNRNQNQNLTVLTFNNKHNKGQNQQGLSHQQYATSPEWYSAMYAAAIASGNIHSPVNHQKQQFLQMANNKPNHQAKNKHDLTDNSKSSNDYVGSMMNPNHQKHHVNNSQQVQQNSDSNLATNYQNNGGKSANSQYVYNYQNQQSSRPPITHSQQPLNGNNSVNIYAKSTSIASYSSSSSSSAASSNTPNQKNNAQPAQNQNNQNLPVYSNNSSHSYTHMGPNNTAINYVNNNSAAINSGTTINAPVLQNVNGQVLNIIPPVEQYSVVNGTNQYIHPVNTQQQQYTVYPNYYYYTVPHQNNLRQTANTPNSSSNGDYSNTNTSSTVSSNTPGSLTPQSQPIYYAPVPSQSTGIQQPALTPTETNYSQNSNSNVSTITSAFETATNSSNTDNNFNNNVQTTSSENLEEMFQNNLNLQPQQGQPQYHYVTQPGYLPNTNIAQNGQLQYYYYYTPGLPQNPMQNYQNPATLVQAISNNQTLPSLDNQRTITNYSQNSQPSPYPIQINTMNGYQPCQMAPIVPTNQQSQVALGAGVPVNGGVPLLQLPQLNQYQIPNQVNQSMQLSLPTPPQNQIQHNVQSPNQHNMNLGHGKVQPNRNQFYNNQSRGSYSNSFGSQQRSSKSDDRSNSNSSNPNRGGYTNQNSSNLRENNSYRYNQNNRTNYNRPNNYLSPNESFKHTNVNNSINNMPTNVENISLNPNVPLNGIENKNIESQSINSN